MTEKEDTSERDTKKIEVNIGLDDVLRGTSNLIDIVTRLKKDGESSILSLEEIKDLKEKTKGLFGVSIKVGTGGIFTTKEVIGKLHGEDESLLNKRIREPVADIFEEKDYIEVIAELPGLEEKDIKYEIKNDILTIYSNPPEADKRKYRKELPLPFPVSANDIQSAYKNGILKLRLKKLA